MLGLVLFAWLHGSEIAVLDPKGPIALQERGVIGITILLCSFVVVPVFFILFFFSWKYRADSPEAKISHKPNWDHDNMFVEFLWWLVPTIIVISLAVIAWKTAHQLDPFKPLTSGNAPITVDVIALDWKWLFIYPQQNIASVNLVEFPENTPVHFYITSDAPVNSFWIPSLGGQIMAMPGMTTQLNLAASSIGNFNGFSAEISGDGFAGMAFTAKSVSSSDFAVWVQSVKQPNATPLNSTTYAALAKPSEYNPVSYYSPIDPELYTENVMKYMMPPSDSMPGMQMTP